MNANMKKISYFYDDDDVDGDIKMKQAIELLYLFDVTQLASNDSLKCDVLHSLARLSAIYL